MAVTFIIGVTHALSNYTTTFTLTLPATEAGDTIIIECVHRGTGDGTWAGTYSGPAFQQKHKQLFGGSLYSGQSRWSRATGNHSGETVIVSGLINSCAGVCTVYRGADETDPLGDATIVGEQNASGDETQAQITTGTAGAWPVLMVVNSPDLAVASQACTSPGALTERIEKLNTGGTDCSIAHASAEKASAGGTGAFTWAQTNAASGSWAYAIKPAPANDALTANGLAAGAPVLATPTLSQVHGLSASGLAAGAPVLAAPTLAQVHALSANSLAAGAPTLATPTLTQQANHALTANGLSAGAPMLATPTISQGHALSANGLAAGAPILATPTLAQVHALTANALAAGAPVLATPTIAQGHVLTANGLAAGAPILATPTLAQVHALVAQALSAGAPTLAHPILAEEGTDDHDLIANGLATGAPTLGSPTLAQVHALVASALSLGAPTLGTPTLSVEGAILEYLNLITPADERIFIDAQTTENIRLATPYAPGLPEGGPQW